MNLDLYMDVYLNFKPNAPFGARDRIRPLRAKKIIKKKKEKIKNGKSVRPVGG